MALLETYNDVMEQECDRHFDSLYKATFTYTGILSLQVTSRCLMKSAVGIPAAGCHSNNSFQSYRTR